VGLALLLVPFFLRPGAYNEHPTAMAATASFAPFAEHKYLNLETFRKSGEGVRTPIWFAAETATGFDSTATKLYLYTVGNSGKIKRIRNNPRVRIAPCDMRGKVLGEWVDARAEIVTGVEAAHGMSLLDKKYMPWKQILGFFAMFRRQQRAVLAIHPA
jgi:PPOX class probable F420-dependent enzyme